MINRHCNIVFAGDTNVGKTSIINRAVGNSLDSINETVTAGCVQIAHSCNNRVYELNIMDTAGQEKYRSLIPAFFRNANIVYLVCDVSKKETFDNFDEWMKLIKQSAPDNFKLVIIGNKCDLVNQRVIFKKDLFQISMKYEASTFYETSAISDLSMDYIFEQIYTGDSYYFDNENEIKPSVIKFQPPQISTCC